MLPVELEVLDLFRFVTSLSPDRVIQFPLLLYGSRENRTHFLIGLTFTPPPHLHPQCADVSSEHVLQYVRTCSLCSVFPRDQFVLVCRY